MHASRPRLGAHRRLPSNKPSHSGLWQRRHHHPRSRPNLLHPLDFTPCKNCDFQIEGQLIVSRDDWAYWNAQDAIFKVASVNGATIRSLTGTGLIDGNARDYYNRGWRTTYEGPHFLHVTNGSSNVHVDNMTVKNVPMRFFRADGNSTKLTYSRLSLSVVGQYSRPPVVESETFGFEMADVTNVTIDTVSMEFTTLGNIQYTDLERTVGVCVAFDRGTNGITVKNVNCKNAWRGAVAMIGTTITNAWTKAPTGSGISNIYVSNLTYQGDFGTGFTNALSEDKISNITWDSVTILGGGAAEGNRCYMRCACMTGHYRACEANDWKPSFENVRFKNFKGKLGAMPGPGWGCASNQTECDIKFEGWTPTL